MVREEKTGKIGEERLLKALGLKDDDVIIEFARYRERGTKYWNGWIVTYSTIIKEEVK